MNKLNRYKKVIKDIIIKVNQIYSGEKINFNSYIRLGLITKYMKSIEAIAFLDKKRFFEDSAIILRTVFETFITILYCECDTENYRRFYDYNAVTRYGYITADKEILDLFNSIDNKNVKKLQLKEQEFMKKYKVNYNYNWSNNSIKTICKKLDKFYNKEIFSSMYLTIYKNYSDFVHPNIINLFSNYIKISENKIKCNTKPCYYEQDDEIIRSIEEMNEIFMELC